MHADADEIRGGQPGLAVASVASGELAPKTLGTSEPVFSRMVLAAATEPTSQPAGVKGTQGAGAVRAGRTGGWAR